MRKLVIGLFVLMLAISNVQPVKAHADERVMGSKAAPETNRVIVKLKSSSYGIHGVKSVEMAKRVNTSMGKFITLKVPRGTSISRFIAELEKRKDVVYAEPDRIIKLQGTPNDPDLNQQWHHDTIHTEKAWQRSKGAGVTVAVIDDGMDLSHPDLRLRIVRPYDVVSDTPYPSKGEHGTHVGGIIASNANNALGGAGVAPESYIMPIDVFDGDGAYTSDIVYAIQYAVYYGADIINMSLASYYYSSSFNSAVQYAYQHGVLVVASAGNDETNSPAYPAAYDHVLSVGATDKNDQLSWFSNYGSNVDMTAPGSSIWSTIPGGYGYMSGTSMASPIVAGVAALVKASDASFTSDDLYNRLTRTADDLGSSGRDYYYGSGRVNAAKALRINDLESPQIKSSLSDQSTTIEGIIQSGIQDPVILVYNPSGEIGRVTPSGMDFKVTISKQKAGTPIYVYVMDEDGYYSEPTSLTVLDRTAPPVPALQQVTDQSTSVTGKTESVANVHLKVNHATYQLTADTSGKFSKAIARQKAGATIEVWSVDKAGNKSSISKTAVKDGTAPTAPKVNGVTDHHKSITGKAEVNSHVTIKIGSKTYTGKASKSGSYSIAIPMQKAGVKVEVRAIDAAGNKSKSATATVTDKTPPPAPKVNKVTTKSKVVTGTAEGGARIEVKIGSKKLGSATADKNGKFTVSIKPQKKGTILSVTATDKVGNKSKAASIKVS